MSKLVPNGSAVVPVTDQADGRTDDADGPVCPLSDDNLIIDATHFSLKTRRPTN